MYPLIFAACLIPVGLALYALACLRQARTSPEEQRLEAVLDYRL